VKARLRLRCQLSRKRPHGAASAFNPAPHACPRAARGSAPLWGRLSGGSLSAPLYAADTVVSRGRLRLPLRGTERSAFGPNRSEGFCCNGLAPMWLGLGALCEWP
jgi:hypothetical protein